MEVLGGGGRISDGRTFLNLYMHISIMQKGIIYSRKMRHIAGSRLWFVEEDGDNEEN